MIRSYLLLVITIFSVALEVKGDQMRRILRLLERMEIEKAVEVLNYGLKEDANHAGYLWIAANLASTDTSSYFDLDSAYGLVKGSLVAYDSADEEQLVDFDKVPFNRSMIEQTDALIMEKYWERTQVNISDSALLQFIELYPAAAQVEKADFQIDSLGFEEAISRGTWQAYLSYQETHPGSVFNEEAEKRYQLLVYQDLTYPESDDRLHRFIENYGNSPHRDAAIGRLLQYKLFWNHADTLLHYAVKYEGSSHVKRMLDYAYHIDPWVITEKRFRSLYPELDSLEMQDQLAKEAVFLLPTSEKVKAISFQNQNYHSIELEQVKGDLVHCGAYKWDFYFGVKDGVTQVTQRSGLRMIEGHYLTAQEVGFGTILLKNAESKGFLFHKTGEVILENINQAAMFGGRWIKVEREGMWALASLNGEFLTKFEYDLIEEVGNFWMFRKNERYAFTNPESVSSEIGTGGFTLLFKYEDYEIVDEDWMIGFRGDHEALINQDLAFIIPWGRHEIFPNKDIPYTRKGGRYTLYPQSLDMVRSTYDEVLVSQEWIAVKDSVWKYRSLSPGHKFAQADSARLIGDRQLLTMDTAYRRIHFSNDAIVNLEEGEDVRLLEYTVGSSDVEENYLLITNENLKKIYDVRANLLFEFEGLENIKPVGDSLFIGEGERGKSGVLLQNGEWLLQPRYNFINRTGDMLNLVFRNEIGSYSLVDSLFFDTDYLTNVEPFGQFYATSKASGKGIINHKEEEILAFEHEDLAFYSDSLVWVKTDSSWQVQHLFGDKILQYGIRSYEKLSIPNGLAYKVITASGYGLMDQRGDYIIQPGFSDIRIISDGEAYFFIGEIAVPEAAFYIWVGFDANGKKFFSEAYREEEYDRIACD